MKRIGWTGLPVAVCLFALLWPVRGVALEGVRDAPAGENLTNSHSEFRRCESPLPLGLEPGRVSLRVERTTSDLLMEQQFAADCNRRKAMRWEFCAVVLAMCLWFRRKDGDTAAVKIQTLLLAGSTAAATGAVMAAKAAGLIYTTAFHILWVSCLLFLVGNRYLTGRDDGAMPSSKGHDQDASDASRDSVSRR